MGNKGKDKALSMMALLKQHGVTFNYQNIDSIGKEFSNSLAQHDLTQNCNKYIWKGLPDDLTSWLIELMLYVRGTLCGFFCGGKFFVLPYANAGELDVYGRIKKIQPIVFNGDWQKITSPTDKSKEKIFGSIYNVYDYKDGDNKAAILFDTMPLIQNNSGCLARYGLNRSFVDWQADILGRIKINIHNATKKVYIEVENDDQKEQLYNDLCAMFGSCDPFVIGTKGNKIGTNSSFVDMKIDLQAQELVETYESVNAIRCSISGIANTGAFNKKERVITGELEDDEQQTEAILDCGLKMRKLWLSQLKDMYPEKASILDKITVEINNVDRSDILKDYNLYEDNKEINNFDTEEE